MTTTLKGSCLCGQIAYAIEAKPQQFYFCECAQCRKVTGSVAAANLLVEPTPVQWLRGESLVRRFDADDGRAFSKVFCARCGSGLPFLNTAGDTLFIPAGSLDNAPPMAVQRRIFCAERPAWAPLDATLPADPGFPE